MGKVLKGPVKYKYWENLEESHIRYEGIININYIWKVHRKDLGSIPGTPYKEILFWKRALNPIEFITNQIKFIKNLL